MRRLYFEISDTLKHAAENSRVTGIQRVQLTLLRHLARTYGCDQVRGLFFNSRQRRFYEFDIGELLEEVEFDAELLLRKLGMLRNWRMLPSRPDVKKYLLPHKGRKLLRTIKKIDLYLSALCLPRRFAAVGLKRTCDRYGKIAVVRRKKIVSLNTRHALVFLGANWLFPAVQAFAHRHRLAGGDVVQFMHDLIPRVHPEYCTTQVVEGFNRWLERVPNYANRIICVSESTARDLNQAAIDAPQPYSVSILKLAHEMDGFERNAQVNFNLEETLKANGREFVLCVGTIEIRKNGAALLRAWLRMTEENVERLPLLVFAGQRGWHTENFDTMLAAYPRLTEYVRLINAPSDRMLACLYGRCLFTVFPSFYEGWGLPIGESAWFGKFCVASSTSSMPEVCGDLMEYIDPCDDEALISALRRAITDRDYLRQRESGIAQAALSRWQQVADELVATLIRLE